MSLLDEFAEEYTLLEKSRVPDGQGGHITTWIDGATFIGYPSLDNSIEARIAKKQGVTSVFTFTVRKDFPIDYHDVFRSNKSGDTYRVTSEPNMKEAPKSALLQLKYFTAERWDLPQ